MLKMVRKLNIKTNVVMLLILADAEEGLAFYNKSKV